VSSAAAAEKYVVGPGPPSTILNTL